MKKPRMIFSGICRDMPGYGGIWWDMVGYGGIWRDMAGYGGIWWAHEKTPVVAGVCVFNAAHQSAGCVMFRRSLMLLSIRCGA